MPTWTAISFQNSASPSMEQLIFFHDSTMAILFGITLLVTVSLLLSFLYSLTDRLLLQEQTVETIWTILPVFILFAIALPSLQTLYLLDDPFKPDLTIKAMGHQWYWSYEYSDFPSISFDSFMQPMTSDLSLTRLLETDNNLVLPTHTRVRLIASSTDVIHSWALPSLGLKTDAVPGRLNQMIFTLDRPGILYGQCSEICGSNHSFMPIKLESVPLKFFLEWTLNSLTGVR